MDNVAVCISGLATPSHIAYDTLLKNIERMMRILPYPFFFAQWKGREVALPYECLLLEEPNPHYHCVADIIEGPSCHTWVKYREHKLYSKPERYGHSKHWTKQLLSHNRLLDRLPEKYTTIIRLRYDSYLNSSVDWNSLINEAREENIAIGGWSPKYGYAGPDEQTQEFNTLKPIRHRPLDCNFCKTEFLWDQCIIHNRSLMANLETLYEKKQLRAAEWGWHQVLGLQHNKPTKNIENIVLMMRKFHVIPNLSPEKA